MHNRLTNVQRLSFVALLVLIIHLSLSVSPLLSQDITIGTQTWTSKNLDVSTFRNGEAIPEAKSKEEWKKAGDNKTAAFCYYEYDSKNGKVYGKLYNWYAVNDSRGLAPKGYHIPSDAEWTILTDFLGGEDIAGKKMKSKDGWKSYEEGGKKTCPDCADWTQSYRDQVPCHICKNSRYVKAPVKTLSGNGDNSSRFNGLPGGYCNNNGSFNNMSDYGNWWSSSEYGTNNAWYRFLGSGNARGSRYDFSKNNGFSVRCLRD
jgi:uncharacterized protein (TIGR02145 family)